MKSASVNSIHCHTLPDLIEKCRSAFIEADGALLGVGDLSLRLAYVKCRLTATAWKLLTEHVSGAENGAERAENR